MISGLKSLRSFRKYSRISCRASWKMRVVNCPKTTLSFVYSQGFHRLEMFFDHVFQKRILLIIRKSHAKHIAHRRDVMNQCAASQLDIVGMCAEEEHALSVEVHMQSLSLRAVSEANGVAILCFTLMRLPRAQAPSQ